MSRKRLTPEHYSVGWLCALECEYLAAILMLDEEHDSPEYSNPYDKNIYTYGEINKHNVIIVSMPTGDPGKVSAALTAQYLQDSFKLKIYLFVGIAGGYPCNFYDNKPIFLGDVVVGSPKAPGSTAVFEHDRGRKNPGEFLSFSILDKPVRQLVALVDQVERKAKWGNSSFHRHLDRLTAGNLAKTNVDFESPDMFNHPGPQYDILFKSDSKHEGGPDSTCSNCDKTAVLRYASSDNKPRLHRGTIASGDTVVQDADMREQLHNSFDHAICFEMEAAGVMDLTHCLIIRGISDYADSHKHYRWHNYAAATAAAFAREALMTLPTAGLKDVDSKPLSAHGPPAAVSSSSTAVPAPMASVAQVGPETEAAHSPPLPPGTEVLPGSANSAEDLVPGNASQHQPLKRHFRKKGRY